MPVGAFCAFLGFWRLVRYFTLFLGHAQTPRCRACGKIHKPSIPLGVIKSVGSGANRRKIVVNDFQRLSDRAQKRTGNLKIPDYFFFSVNRDDSFPRFLKLFRFPADDLKLLVTMGFRVRRFFHLPVLLAAVTVLLPSQPKRSFLLPLRTCRKTNNSASQLTFTLLWASEVGKREDYLFASPNPR